MQEHLCISEEQSIVYRALPGGPQALPPGDKPRGKAAWSTALTPDASLLFRFSALTYNGHRIHYDREYAMEEEFYPSLVVHGPLLATLLLDLQRRQMPDASVSGFTFRAVRPAFEGASVTLAGSPGDGTVELWTSDADGCLGMSALATLR
jgi:3-methylfumaryl-CoA hydratase